MSSSSSSQPPRAPPVSSWAAATLAVDDGHDSTAQTTAAKTAIDFLTLARGLKTTERTGWVRQRVPSRIESVADHSWRIALMAMVASSFVSPCSSSPEAPSSAAASDTTPAAPLVDANKCIKMALVHDLAESIVGDITPHCGVSDGDKYEMELSAMKKMTDLFLAPPGENRGRSSSPSPGVGREILDLWREYEEGKSPEAMLVKDLDKLEMILQAQEYEGDDHDGDSVSERGRGKSLDGFFDGTRGRWRTPIGRQWGAEIEARRPRKRRRQESETEGRAVPVHEEDIDSKPPAEAKKSRG